MQNFDDIARHILDDLLTQFEDRFGDAVELDLNDGVLRAAWPDGTVYLINRHLPLRQIWLSSPKSGAWHFAPDNRCNWLSTRGDKIPLAELLNRELEPATPFHIAVTAA